MIEKIIEETKNEIKIDYLISIIKNILVKNKGFKNTEIKDILKNPLFINEMQNIKNDKSAIKILFFNLMRISSKYTTYIHDNNNLKNIFINLILQNDNNIIKNSFNETLNNFGKTNISINYRNIVDFLKLYHKKNNCFDLIENILLFDEKFHKSIFLDENLNELINYINPKNVDLIKKTEIKIIMTYIDFYCNQNFESIYNKLKIKVKNLNEDEFNIAFLEAINYKTSTTNVLGDILENNYEKKLEKNIFFLEKFKNDKTKNYILNIKENLKINFENEIKKDYFTFFQNDLKSFIKIIVKINNYYKIIEPQDNNSKFCNLLINHIKPKIEGNINYNIYLEKYMLSQNMSDEKINSLSKKEQFKI